MRETTITRSVPSAPYDGSAAPFRVAFVCTANRFRSPLAARLLERLAQGLPLAVSSHGVLDLGPVGPLPEAVALGDRLGVDLRAHRARPLTAHEAKDYDLLLGFERAHVASAVIELEVPRARTFTLPELVELLDGTPYPLGTGAENARSAVAAAQRLRATTTGIVPEVRDPVGGPPGLYREVAEQTAALTAALTARLFTRAVAEVA
jgi:protein-tyrosine phosphatase